jgi:hypothetical protein
MTDDTAPLALTVRKPCNGHSFLSRLHSINECITCDKDWIFPEIDDIRACALRLCDESLRVAIILRIYNEE